MSPPASHWVHDLSPFLIRFNETLGVRYYGLAYVLGFVGAWVLLRLYHRTGRSPIGPDAIADLMTSIVLGVLIGGRIGYFLLYQPHSLASDPLLLFRVWEGGMASHGGFVGVTGALWWWSRRHRVPLLPLADLIVTTAPLGLLLGRVANFINGELWGRVSSVPWAVIFPTSVPPGTPAALIEPRHPSQLYQATLEGALLFAYLQWRLWQSDDARSRRGRLSGEFLLGYALARIVGELFREPDAPLLLGLSRGTFYSLFLIAAGAILIAHSRRPQDEPA